MGLPRKGSYKELLDAEGIESIYVRSNIWTIAVNSRISFCKN